MRISALKIIANNGTTDIIIQNMNYRNIVHSIQHILTNYYSLIGINIACGVTLYNVQEYTPYLKKMN